MSPKNNIIKKSETLSSSNPKKKILKFLGILAGVLVLEYLVFYQFAPEFLTFGLQKLNAFIVGAILNVFGVNAQVIQNIINLPISSANPEGMILTVVYECTGGFAFFIFSACVFAYPSKWLAKLLGHFIGIAGIFILNLIRLVVISIVANSNPSLFTFLHKYLWQVTFIIVVLVLWGFWVDKIADKKPALSDKE